jgi:hypothetical protein
MIQNILEASNLKVRDFYRRNRINSNTEVIERNTVSEVADI